MVSSTLLEVTDDDDDEEEDDESTDLLLPFFGFLGAVGTGSDIASCFDPDVLSPIIVTPFSSSSSSLTVDLVRFDLLPTTEDLFEYLAKWSIRSTKVLWSVT